MGLDMYAYSVSKRAAINDTTLLASDDRAAEDVVEIQYWRKNNALHAWMERLYQLKGGTEEFNCEYVRLREEDLIRLQKDIKEKQLIPASGFFWGNLSYDAEDQGYDLKFVEQALREIKADRAVYYSSWW